MPGFDAAKNYYQVLGLEPGASGEEVERRYRSLATSQHPDKGGSEEEMKLLNEAREVLTDARRRREYDRERSGGPSVAPYGSSKAFDPAAASRQGNLEIPNSEGDYFGLLIGAIACIGLGLPFLVLIEMQYVFFLWPLRLMTIAVLAIGILMGHSAMRQRRKRRHAERRKRLVVVQEALFWGATLGGAVAVYLLLY